MTEINTQKFYQFLAGFGKDNAWASVADENHGDSDGYVIKSEFRSFMNAEWNGNENGELTNDIINKFWKEIDTGRSANKIGDDYKDLNVLSDKELEDLDKRLSVYSKFDEFFKNNVKVPDVLSTTGPQWTAAVKDKLSEVVEKYIKKSDGDLEDMLKTALPAIIRECTAQYSAVEYQEELRNGILKEYPDYKVADDNTLQGLIDQYLATINDTEITPDAIYDSITTLIDAYLATAGLGDGEVDDFAGLEVTPPTGLNDLQKAVITQKIKDDLAGDIKDYEGFENAFNNAVQKFIDAKIAEGLEFEDLINAAAEFKSSDFKKELDNIKNIETNYRDVKAGTDFYKKLEEAVGETLAKRIEKNDRYIKEYQEILDDVIAKLNAGELESDKVEDYIIQQISAKLEKFVGNMSEMSISELNDMYDKLATSAESNEDADEALKLHREAAIKWCDAISKKGATLKAKIAEIFESKGYSSDYKNAINDMLPGDIQEIMAELKDAVLKIGAVEELEVIDSTWDNMPGTVILKSVKDIKGYQITPIFRNQTIDTSRITYKSSNTNIATIDENGFVTFKSANVKGNYSVKLSIIVDGKVIKTKDVIVKCEAEIDLTKEDAVYNGNPISEILKNHGSTINLGNFQSNWDTLRREAKAAVATSINSLKDILIQAGYDANKVEMAAQTTINYYSAAIDAIKDNRKNAGSQSNTFSFQYVDANGITRSSGNTSYTQWSNDKYSDVNGGNIAANMGSNTTGLQLSERYYSTNHYKIFINVAVMIEKFQDFFNKL